VYLALALLLVLSDAHHRGVQLYEQKKYHEAITVLEEAAKSEAEDTAPYKQTVLLIGKSYFMLGQATRSIPWLIKLPESTEANYMLGYAYLQDKQPALSTSAFARLFGVKRDSAAAHLLAGQMMLKKDYAEEAAVEVRRALELDPKLPEAHFLLGEIAMFRGRVDDGLEEMKKELALNPNFSMAWYRLGDAYTRKENWSLAIPNLQRAVWLNQEFSGPYILLGKCYSKMGRLADAEGILKRALEIDPNNHSARYLLGQTLIAEGKQDEGRAVLEKLKRQ